METRVLKMFFLFFVYEKLVSLKTTFPNYPQRTRLNTYIENIKALILLNKNYDLGTFNYVQTILKLKTLYIFASEDSIQPQSTMTSANNLAATYTSSVSSCISSECCESSYNFITVS